mmetsp:Transcript_20174/g.43553  ORF Transcript_20174/g.43553 Transcript_20174/m.43553 type:complete len:769 (+) Transcript_20174:34-2340(+)|eukprot:CAMPEP_0168741222 /NCGR_PEP_ID=MMETSP0724-20121128/12394_1 /TAXON_ID=265536 /ORGANISM="Amphiprora sp., Strain CCMP467" /LENGTH=768 /DNA_ID=CAMNT_0008788703 /DNA_START=66 /DNA_END=2372 /DNA_ORIENTATION=-
MKSPGGSSMAAIGTSATLSLLLLLLSSQCSLISGQTLSTGIDLGGSIITRTNVQPYADLSQDMAEIGNLIAQNQPAEGLRLYQSGQHAESAPGVRLSLEALADSLVAADPKTPSFLFHLYGQADRQLNLAFDSAKLSYINNQITEYFSTQPALALEATYVLNVWMVATHLLYNGVYECHKRAQADDPDAATVDDLGMAGWDKFMALWIGSGQQPGATNGDSLYAWTQRVSSDLGYSNGAPGLESPTNTRLKLLYSEAVTLLSTAGACRNGNAATADRLWQLVVNAVSEMSKPLFQGLLVALKAQDAPRVDLYAKALVPQLAKCRPSLYKKFHESWITGRYQVGDDVSELLSMIPDLTFCFGYSCQDLGNTEIGACDTFDVFRPTLGGYVPQSEVGNVAAADLDILQIKILTELSSNKFAEFMYMNGANIAKYRQQGTNDPLDYVSLHDIGVSSERSSAQPFFDIYVTYHDEKDYADKIVRGALTGASKWKASQQISEIVALTSAYQILLMEAITKLKIATQECRDADPEIGVTFTLNPIDEAAALLIGSMEGAMLGGSRDLEDGQLIYNIANRHAFQFNTINSAQYAKSVSTIEDLLFAARAELDALDCENLELSTESILKYAMVGITQACIQLAVKNEDLGDLSTAASLAQGESLALAILPMIYNTNKDLAGDIEANMIRLQGEDPVTSGGAAVGKMFGKGFTEAFLLFCENLGSIQAVDPCEGVSCSGCSHGKTTSDAMIASTNTWMLLTTTALGAIVALGLAMAM